MQFQSGPPDVPVYASGTTADGIRTMQLSNLLSGRYSDPGIGPIDECGSDPICCDRAAPPGQWSGN